MNVESVNDQIVSWLAAYADYAKVKGFVVGISGGVDSAVTSTLCAQTGFEVLCVEMPIHQAQSQVSRGREHIEQLKNRFPNVWNVEADLTHTFETFKKAVPDTDDVVRGNLALANTRARLRMTTLYYFAGIHGLLVAGTGNKVEDFGVGALNLRTTATLTIQAGDRINVTAIDDSETASASTTIQCTGTSRPTVTITCPAKLVYGEPMIFIANGLDPDGDTKLAYSWYVNGTPVPKESSPKLTATVAKGDVLTVTVTDSEGAVSASAAADCAGNSRPTVALVCPEKLVYGIAASGPPVDANEVESADQALEVMVMWGRSVLHVDHLRPARSFWVGEAESKTETVDYLISPEVLGTQRMPIALVSGGATHLVFPEGATGELLRDGERVTIESIMLEPCAELPGARQLVLPAGATVSMHYKGFTFVTKPVRAGKKVAAGLAWDWAPLTYAAGVLAMVGVLLGAMYFSPPSVAGLNSDVLDPNSRLAQFIITPSETEGCTKLALAE